MTNQTQTRYEILDTIRGFTLINMIIYHALWDVVYILGINLRWYKSDGAHLWQQWICWTFIFLSGFCLSLGKHKLRRGLIVFGGGLLVTLVTCLFTPGERVVFGVLTLLGSSMLLLTLTEKLWSKLPSLPGILLSFITFIITKPINHGYLGIGSLRLNFPDSWNDLGYFMTFLGIRDWDFFSTDYFSLIPWFFLFLTGYYTYRLFAEKEWLFKLKNPKHAIPPFHFLGRHSLLIYLLHQPVLYALTLLVSHIM